MSAENLENANLTLEDSKKETINEPKKIKIGSLTVQLKSGESGKVAASIKRTLEASLNSVTEGTPEAKKIASDDAFNQIEVTPQRSAGVPSGNFIVEEYWVPDHMVGLVIGRGGEHIIRMQTITGCKIQFASDSNGAPNRACMLAGRRDSVLAAKKMLDELISNASSPAVVDTPNLMHREYVEDIIIPAHKIGLIIGKGGENIRNLQDKGGVKMKFIQDKSDSPLQDKPLRISGDFHKVECAKRMLVDVLAQTYKNKSFYNSGPSITEEQKNFCNAGPSFTQEQIMIPRKDVGVVVGKGCNMIQRIEHYSGAKVQFLHEKEDVLGDKFCLITGNNFAVQKAAGMINDLIEKVLILVPDDAVGFVIGKNGNRLKKIQERSGATVQFIEENVQGDRLCQIAGTMEQVKLASHHITQLINEAMRVLGPKLSEKEKVLLVISYIGRSSFGFKEKKRKWKDLESKLEEDFLMALLIAGVISDREFNLPKLIDLEVAVDTEKSISAARNFVSLFIPAEDMNDSFPNKINLHLPPDCRISAVRRVSRNFCLRTNVARQTYSYMLPTLALAPTANESTEEYRIDENRIQEVNEFFETYVEELHFYNCLSHSMEKRLSSERKKSAIISCKCTSPFELRGFEFCIIKVRMRTNKDRISLVRQVVGLAIAVMRNLTSIIKCFMNDKIEIPRAPGFSIFLEEPESPFFEQILTTSDGWFTELADFEDSIEEFKLEMIYLHIAVAEQEGKFMLHWLRTLNHHRFDVKNVLEPKIASKEHNRHSVEELDPIVITHEASKSDANEKRNRSSDAETESDGTVSIASQSPKSDSKRKRKRHSISPSGNNTAETHIKHSSKLDPKEKLKTYSVTLPVSDTKITIINLSSDSDAEEESPKCDSKSPQKELFMIPELKSIQDIGKSIQFSKNVKKSLDQVLHRKAKKK